MKPMPRTAELERVARRLVWSEAPAKALADPVRLLAYAMTYGTHEDMHTLRRYLGDEDLREALDRAPPGIFDPRSSTGTSCSTAGRRRRCRSGSCRSGRRD